jgi:three-Cys-motif partner protein
VILDEYLKFYTTALKNMPFKLHYADAFAGTGSHDPVIDGEQNILIPNEDFRGSVLTALSVDPGFYQYHFNDLNPEHVEALNELRKEFPERNIRVSKLDANRFVPKFCNTLGPDDRAILFLDPYSTQLDWDTLSHVANSQKIDLWLLFPLSVILRMTPKDGAKVKPEWKSTLDRLLGTSEWEEALYKKCEVPVIQDLFDELDQELPIERVNSRELQQWVTERLKQIFPYVAEPTVLKNKGSPLFLFYFAVSNKSPRAHGLADRVAKHILKKNFGD